MSHNPSIAAIVVTFHPDEKITDRLERIRAQVDQMVIVDNGSPVPTLEMLKSWSNGQESAVIGNPHNRGLSAALNQGLEWAAEKSCQWAVTFDQDSTPQPGMVGALLSTVANLPDSERVAVVGAQTFDEHRAHVPERWLQPRWWGFERRDCTDGDLEQVTFVITSGALTRVSVWRELGGFDEGLFIDYIDHDFCLRARTRGWKTLVSAGARLAHNLGSKREVEIIGRRVRPTFHSSSRHYYMARNRILMWRRHAWRFPHWWMFDACFGGMNTVRVLLAEDKRVEKMSAMLRGTWHGLLGRTGKMPNS